MGKGRLYMCGGGVAWGVCTCVAEVWHGPIEKQRRAVTKRSAETCEDNRGREQSSERNREGELCTARDARLSHS